MKLILLPGNVPTNKQWVHNAAQAFSDIATDILEQNYTHWDTGAKIIDFDAELAKLSEALQGESKYSIFAKSAGAILAICGVQSGTLKPERCVFVGLPFKWADKNGFPLREWLKQFNVPTLLLEQTEDPLGPFAEVQTELSQLDNNAITITEIPGNDHEYNDFSLLRSEALQFLLDGEKEVRENMNETHTTKR